MNWSPWVGAFFFLIALIFAYRSFYGMRIPEEDAGAEGVMVIGAPEDKLDKKK
jgi:hypothetical protein